jgi:DNA-binding transcriptional ArsR family regulator
VDDVFKALADPNRRKLLDRLFKRDGQTLGELCERVDMTRFGVMKHLRVLEEAGLVVSEKRGREKLHYLNPMPIRLVHDRWVSKYRAPFAAALSDLKSRLENPMAETQVYELFIRTTPEKLWQALTDPAFTKRYWGVEFESDWTKGAPMTWREKGVDIRDPEQVVLVSEPYQRLSYTWHTVTPEWGRAHDATDETVAELAAERRTKVTFDIEPTGPAVKLTVTHDDFQPGSALLDGFSQGWPAIISSLKTLLESGEPLPQAAPA